MAWRNIASHPIKLIQDGSCKTSSITDFVCHMIVQVNYFATNWMTSSLNVSMMVRRLSHKLPTLYFQRVFSDRLSTPHSANPPLTKLPSSQPLSLEKIIWLMAEIWNLCMCMCNNRDGVSQSVYIKSAQCNDIPHLYGQTPSLKSCPVVS